MRKNRIRLTESDLHNIITESVKGILNEYEQDIDDDTYFDEGLPDDSFREHNQDIVKDVNDILKQMRPYLDKLWDLAASANGYVDQFTYVLNKFECLPQITRRYLYY